MIRPHRFACLVALAFQIVARVDAFAPTGLPFVTTTTPSTNRRQRSSTGSSSSLLRAADKKTYLTRVSDEDEGVPIPFVDNAGNAFIDCYADSIASVNGVEYTIGVPCDYCVALCYYDNDNLVPVELNDDLMDDIFTVAENIVTEEFGEELSLQRTPQTLTLVGELEEEEEEEDDEDDDLDDDEIYTGEEEVEVLLSFDFRDKEFNLVRLLDPVLLVGKTDAERPDLRMLLTPEESDMVMPALEDMFLKYHEERDSMIP